MPLSRRQAKLAVAFGGAAVVALIGLVVALDPPPSANPPQTPSAIGPAVRGALAGASDDVLPLSFERNLGQADRGVMFLARGLAGTVYLTGSEAMIVPSRSGPAKPEGTTDALSIRLASASRHPVVRGADPLPGRVNYLIGRRSDWQTGVPTYRQVIYRSVYRGIDLRYNGAENQLAYSFDLRAGADPSRIVIDLGGAKRLRIDHAGNLWVTLGDSTLEQRRPGVYQVLGGRRVTVRGGYRLLGRRRVGFTLGEHDAARPLVIDPTIVYSTQLVGSAPGEALGIAVNASGYSYVTGETSSANFPVEHPIQAQAKSATENAFVAKLDPSGALVYATYLGGSAYTAGRGIAVDQAGDAYVTGATNSTDFPTTRGALQRSYGGGPFDAFVTKLNAAGSGLVYSTFLGDTHYDEGNAIAVDGDDGAVITGKTVSPNFPLVRPLAPYTTSGAFVSKLNRAGSRLVSSTVFGGTGHSKNHADSGFGIAADPEGNTYVTGETNDPGFPTVAPLQPTLAGVGNAFVIKINAAMTAVIYATYLGGSGNDIGRAIAADADGNAYVTGQTTSPNFPTAIPIQATDASPGPGGNAFVTKINPAGSAFLYSTYLGGSGNDGAFGIAVDGSQDAYVVGQTSSPDFPSVSPLQRSLNGASDAFLTELDPSGSSLLFSSYYGGSGNDAGLAVALDRTRAVHFAGDTSSSDFPQRGHRGAKRYGTPGDDAFVAVVRPAGQ